MYSLNMIDSLIEPNDKSSKISTQMVWENMFSKKQIRKILREEFKEFFTEEEYKENKRKVETQLDILGILAQQEHIYFDTIIEMLVEKENTQESKELLADWIFELAECNLLELEPVKSNVKIWAKYGLDEETEKLINRLKSLPPMIVKPLETNVKGNNRGSGYLTIGSDSLILNDNHHNKDIDSKFLDLVNSVEYSLNQDVITNIRNCWGDLFDEETNKLTVEYEQKLQSFEEFEKYSIQFMAMLINQDNKFWFTHKYDKRGRIYPMGYWVSYMGNSYQKACIEFKNKELVTHTIKFFEDAE